MGWGDEIIATGQAKLLQRHDSRPVLVIDRSARPRWSAIWNNNPRLIPERRGEYQTLLNAANARPYIEGKLPTRWVWRENFRVEPGEIYLTRAEKAFASPYAGAVLIEPHCKRKPEAVNKTWPWSRWQELADHLCVPMIQVGPPHVQILRNVRFVETQTFRDACAVLSVCRAYVGPEGGLHHAAAALGVPAVVLFSGFIPPSITGYAEHRNIYHGGSACGSRLPCAHCQESLDAISVHEVENNLQEILSDSVRRHIPA